MKNSAFTLIELLVVIVIIGILATIGVAQFNEYQEKARFAKAQAFAAQADSVLMAETVTTGYGFPLRLDFEEGSGTTSVDSSGSGNDVTDWTSQSANVSWITDTPDNSSSSLNIDGALLTVNNVQNMPEDEITFSFFMKLDSFPASYNFITGMFNNATFRIYMNDGLQFAVPGAISEMPISKIKTGRWHHLLGSYKNGTIRLFLDGDLVDQVDNVTLSNSFSVNSSTGLPNLQFFMGYSASGSEFRGSLDRVRIYPVGLDPSNL